MSYASGKYTSRIDVAFYYRGLLVVDHPLLTKTYGLTQSWIAYRLLMKQVGQWQIVSDYSDYDTPSATFLPYFCLWEPKNENLNEGKLLI